MSDTSYKTKIQNLLKTAQEEKTRLDEKLSDLLKQRDLLEKEISSLKVAAYAYGERSGHKSTKPSTEIDWESRLALYPYRTTQVIEIIKALNTTTVSFSQIVTILAEATATKPTTLYSKVGQVLSRMTKQGKLTRLARGQYAVTTKL